MLARERSRRWSTVLWCAAACGIVSTSTAAAEPLHARIDRLIEGSDAGPKAPLIGDAEFLRRVHLDLTGIPPTTDEAREFLDDQAPNKRERLIDRLLGTPHHVRHLAAALDVMLMERRPNQQIGADEWQQYLLKSVQENKPYNQLAREILAADGTDPNLRPAVRFYLDRAAEPNLITRDVGRIFFGRDMQCAQCHDHPLIDDYHQADYHGLYAFVAAGFAFTAPEPDKKTYYAERAGVDARFESVFFKGTNQTTGPHLPGGVELVEPTFYPGDEYQVKPAENVRPVPKFSRRSKLAEEATSGTNRAFNENIANRLWAQMMGRGLVHPVDLYHSANPPSHPELLRLLGEEFARMGFDIKAFLRELALTRTYQRAIDLPESLAEPIAQSAAALSQLDQQRRALTTSAAQSDAAYTAAVEQWTAVEEAAAPIRAEMDQARAEATEAAKKVDEAEKALADTQAQLNAKQGIAQVLSEAAAKAKEAAARLPNEAELAQAAQKFADRAGQIGSEAAALAKSVEEKTAALKPHLEEREASRRTIDAVQARLGPLDEAVRKSEQAMIAARQRMMDDATRLSRLDQRLETSQQLAGLKSLDEQIAQGSQAATDRKAAAEAAQKLATEYANLVAQRKSEVERAEQQHAGAAQIVLGLQQKHERRQQIAKAVGDALAATKAARQLSVEDTALAEAAEALKTRFDQLQSELAEHQKEVDSAVAAQKTAADQLATAKQILNEAVQELASRNEGLKTAQDALHAAVARADADRAARDEALAGLTAKWTASFHIAPLKPLTPEQLCWSILQITGVYQRHVQAEQAELDKTNPLSEEAKKDPGQAARAAEIERRVFEKLKGNVPAFVAIYAASAGQPQGDFFATADQALFAANGGAINGWIAPAGGNLTERIINQPDSHKAAEDLYLTILTRMPTEQEVTDVTAYLAARSQERAACAQELVWALLTSAEFRFNH